MLLGNQLTEFIDFHQVIQESETTWNRANISPIFKKGHKDSPEKL